VSEELDYGIGAGGVVEHLIKIGVVEVEGGIGATATVGEWSKKDPFGGSHGGERELKKEKKREKGKRWHLERGLALAERERGGEMDLSSAGKGKGKGEETRIFDGSLAQRLGWGISHLVDGNFIE
jgi:hypothetical protein